MYIYEIVNKTNGEHDMLMGRNYQACMDKARLNINDYTLIHTEYMYEDFDRNW